MPTEAARPDPNDQPAATHAREALRALVRALARQAAAEAFAVARAAQSQEPADAAPPPR